MSDVQQEYKGHVWYYRLGRTDEPEVVEFPMKVTKKHAENRIAKQLGIDALPADASVSHHKLEKLEARKTEKAASTTKEDSKDK